MAYSLQIFILGICFFLNQKTHAAGSITEFRYALSPFETERLLIRPKTKADSVPIEESGPAEALNLILIDKESRRPVGISDLIIYIPDQRPKIANIPIYIGKEFQGRGIAFEAKSAIIAQVFNQNLADVVWSTIAENNWRSLRLHHRLGFKYYGHGTLKNKSIVVYHRLSPVNFLVPTPHKTELCKIFLRKINFSLRFPLR